MSYFDNGDKIDKWLIERRGKFSASENYKLLPTEKQSKDRLWSATADTYIEQKVIELTTDYYERPELLEVEALLHGKVNEYPAYERYIRETGNTFMTYLGDENPTFIPCSDMPEESGGSPDIVSITSEGKIDYGAEIKNSKNPAYHFRRLKWQSQWDLKEKYIQCYTQIQDLIRVSGAKGWDFISFDSRQKSKAAQIKIIQVKPDMKFINNLELRIRLAVKEKYKIISDHYGYEIKNYSEFLNFINK